MVTGRWERTSERGLWQGWARLPADGWHGSGDEDLDDFWHEGWTLEDLVKGKTEIFDDDPILAADIEPVPLGVLAAGPHLAP